MISAKYYNLKYMGWSLLIHNGVNHGEATQLLSEKLKLPLEGNNSYQKVKSSDNAKVFMGFMNVYSKPEVVFVKQFLFRSFWDFLKHMFRSSRAKRAFDASIMLERYGHKAPLPLVLCEKSIGPFKTQNILVTQKATGTVELRKLLADINVDKSREALKKKRKLIRAFGNTIGKMHSQGIVHGDTRLGNVLVSENEHDYSFWFIDNEGTRHFKRVSLKKIRKNLVQINIRAKVSSTDRMRFMTSYAQQRDFSEDETRLLINSVMEKTSRRVKDRELRKPGKALNTSYRSINEP